MSAQRTAELVRALIDARTSAVVDVERRPAGSERVLVLRNLSGTMQLYELSGATAMQLTDLPEPVTTARYVPGARRAVLGIDVGGNERSQLYLLDLDAARARGGRGIARS